MEGPEALWLGCGLRGEDLKTKTRMSCLYKQRFSVLSQYHSYSYGSPRGVALGPLDLHNPSMGKAPTLHVEAPLQPSFVQSGFGILLKDRSFAFVGLDVGATARAYHWGRR